MCRKLYKSLGTCVVISIDNKYDYLPIQCNAKQTIMDEATRGDQVRERCPNNGKKVTFKESAKQTNNNNSVALVRERTIPAERPLSAKLVPTFLLVP
jgi:hypothetical protein